MKRHIWPLAAGVFCALTLMLAGVWVRSVIVPFDDVLLFRSTGHSAVLTTSPGLVLFKHYSFVEGAARQEFGPRPWWRVNRRLSTDSAMMQNHIWEAGGFSMDFGQNVSTMQSNFPVAKLDEIVLPFWALTALCAIAPLWWLTNFLTVRRRRAQEGLCPSCGFELLDGEDQCPECGRSLGKQAFA